MKELINTDKAPAAVGPYSQAVKVDTGKMIFCSGQIPLDPVSGKIMGASAGEQAEQVLKNLTAVLHAAGAELKNVVKASIYLTSMADFQAVNDVYSRYFTLDLPARICIEVSRLPKDVKVEIEAIAIL